MVTRVHFRNKWKRSISEMKLVSSEPGWVKTHLNNSINWNVAPCDASDSDSEPLSYERAKKKGTHNPIRMVSVVAISQIRN